MIKFNLENNPVYFKMPLFMFFDTIKRTKVKTARMNSIILTCLNSFNSLIQVAHRGFRIKKIQPIHELMTWILPEMVSVAPFGSSGKIPAKIVSTPNRKIHKTNNVWHHFIWVNAKLCPMENIINKIPTTIRFIHSNFCTGLFLVPNALIVSIKWL